MGEWRKDAMPMDGTPICVRAVSTYRYQPYKPTSEQRKRGIKGRWQEMSEYGRWQNCEAPAGDGWMLASEWTPDAAEAPDPAATMKEVREDARSVCVNLAALIENPDDEPGEWRVPGIANEADRECITLALKCARALLAKLEGKRGSEPDALEAISDEDTGEEADERDMGLDDSWVHDPDMEAR